MARWRKFVSGIEVSSTSIAIELLDSDTSAVVPLHQHLIEDQRAEVAFTGIREMLFGRRLAERAECLVIAGVQKPAQILTWPDRRPLCHCSGWGGRNVLKSCSSLFCPRRNPDSANLGGIQSRSRD